MFTAILRYRSAQLALAVLGIVVLLAIFGPWLAPFDPLEQDSTAILSGPSAQHWLGTDNVGRDVFSRLLAGSTVSVLSALQSVLVGFLLGVIPGFLSVYLGRGVEWFTLRLMDALITLPFLVFAVAMTALLGNGLTQAMFAVGILIAPAFYRVTRAAALTVANSQYVEAAALMGATTRWIVLRHAVRKVAPAVGVTFATMTGASLVIVSSLTFLGIGVVPPDPTWGGLLAGGLQFLYQAPWSPVVPALLIVATVWALNAIADAVRDASSTSRRRPSPDKQDQNRQEKIADVV
ncbi:peptide ABC transporter permease [Williamsia sp. 1138]|uniref:ABC transporter permease n=1 Tax=Gordonia rubripertincta TaxID=36822 RepID=A0ABT4MXV6_GORRU|nr:MULTISPECIES: ABC transporter permease [Mycobacteriales]MCZ4551850.1 ABC transporter permease [Gordonia rubripertincta]OZG29115.1 peptide ABC transporter permease [Williamsia sp. 1138]